MVSHVADQATHWLQGETGVRCFFESEVSTLRWQVTELDVEDAMSAPYRLIAKIRTEARGFDRLSLLGKSATVVVDRDTRDTRYSGMVINVNDDAPVDRYTSAVIELVPAMALLENTVQSRVFQHETVPQILDKIFKSGLSPFAREYRFSLHRAYPKCEYRVQYHESDLQFVLRLMQEEGINFWFEQGQMDKKERLVLCDHEHGSPAVVTTSADAEVEFVEYEGHNPKEAIQRFKANVHMNAPLLRLQHYDWTRPELALVEEPQDTGVVPNGRHHYHDADPLTFHGYDTGAKKYQKTDLVDRRRIRQELLDRDTRRMNGNGSATGFRAGSHFRLSRHPQHSLDGAYLLTNVTHHFESDGGHGLYSNGFSCVKHKTPYRPDRTLDKPRIMGIETAKVVGPRDQEIHTDEHGRIRVQFPWDRHGEYNDKSSCFIRVMQATAGKRFGHFFLPRVGMEVAVTFVHGDPDRPVVLGTLYNGDHDSAYAMPKELSKSTIRTQSTPGGNGYHELSFEDAAGKEEIFLRSQKNLRKEVLNNHQADVGADETLTVGRHQTETINGNQSLEVKKDQYITIGQHRIDTVEGEHTETIGKTQKTTVGEDQVVAVHGNRAETVFRSSAETVALFKALSVGLGYQTTVGGAKNETVTLSSSSQVGINHDVRVAKTSTITVGDELRIVVGDSSITLKKNGEVVIAGKKIELNGSKNLTLNGERVDVN